MFSVKPVLLNFMIITINASYIQLYKIIYKMYKKLDINVILTTLCF